VLGWGGSVGFVLPLDGITEAIHTPDMTNANVAGFRIQEVVETPDLVMVDATIDGARYQFAAHKGGAFEVYDYPKSWKGVPRFVGYLPKETSTTLFDGLIARHGINNAFSCYRGTAYRHAA